VRIFKDLPHKVRCSTNKKKKMPKSFLPNIHQSVSALEFLLAFV